MTALKFLATEIKNNQNDYDYDFKAMETENYFLNRIAGKIIFNDDQKFNKKIQWYADRIQHIRACYPKGTISENVIKVKTWMFNYAASKHLI